MLAMVLLGLSIVANGSLRKMFGRQKNDSFAKPSDLGGSLLWASMDGHWGPVVRPPEEISFSTRFVWFSPCFMEKQCLRIFLALS